MSRFPEIDVDDKLRTVYVQLRKGRVHRTEADSCAGVVIDYDHKGKVIGIEFLGLPGERA